ncbi:MAG: hypothetical protein CL624_08175 [Arcobacter sp.]|nr:hypothetical protein [Arcobacter sp.]
MREKNIKTCDIVNHSDYLLDKIEKQPEDKEISKVLRPLLDKIRFSGIKLSGETDDEESLDILAYSLKVKESDLLITIDKIKDIIANLDISVYKSWKNFCRKQKERETTKQISISIEAFERLCGCMKAHYDKDFLADGMNKKDLSRSVITICRDAIRYKNLQDKDLKGKNRNSTIIGKKIK